MNSDKHRPICVADIVALMERVAPPFLAESWDNCGLQVGDSRWPVKSVTVALDPLLPVIQSAVDQQSDMVITHHPLIFKPLRKIDLSTSEGKIIAAALNARLAIYTAHTNLDSAREGINDVLARSIGLDQLVPMVPAQRPAGSPDSGSDPVGQGMGRIGVLTEDITVSQWARKIKEKLGLKTVKVAGPKEQIVRRAAVCSGSGGSLLSDFMASGADVFVSGDLHYHDARAVEEAGRALIDIGHFASEHLMVEALVKRLKQAVSDAGWNIRILPCRIERDPFAFL